MEVAVLEIRINGDLMGKRNVHFPDDIGHLKFKERVIIKERIVNDIANNMKELYNLKSKNYEFYLKVVPKEMSPEEVEDFSSLFNFNQYKRHVNVFNFQGSVVFTGSILAAAKYLLVNKEEAMDAVLKKAVIKNHSLRYYKETNI